jgi:hypothetical protein
MFLQFNKVDIKLLDGYWCFIDALVIFWGFLRTYNYEGVIKRNICFMYKFCWDRDIRCLVSEKMINNKNKIKNHKCINLLTIYIQVFFFFFFF